MAIWCQKFYYLSFLCFSLKQGRKVVRGRNRMCSVVPNLQVSSWLLLMGLACEEAGGLA